VLELRDKKPPKVIKKKFGEKNSRKLQAPGKLGSLFGGSHHPWGRGRPDQKGKGGSRDRIFRKRLDVAQNEFIVVGKPEKKNQEPAFPRFRPTEEAHPTPEGRQNREVTFNVARQKRPVWGVGSLCLSRGGKKATSKRLGEKPRGRGENQSSGTCPPSWTALGRW